MNSFEVFMFMELVQEYAEAYHQSAVPVVPVPQEWRDAEAALERVETELLNLLDCPPL